MVVPIVDILMLEKPWIFGMDQGRGTLCAQLAGLSAGGTWCRTRFLGEYYFIRD